MKKLFLFTLLAIVAISFNACSKDETWPDDSPIIEFKDSYFLEALVKGTDDYDGSKIDKNGDGKISEKEASVVRGLRLSDFKIRCIDEISYFTALETLYCDHNQLTSLDVSKNTELDTLHCDNNQLTSLDVSKNTKLGWFYCDNKQLTSLDVSKNTELSYLYCNNNQLTSLDLSKNAELYSLNCSGNNLKSVIVQRNYNYRLISSLDAITREYGDIISYVF